MLTFAYVPGASQFPFGGDVSVILPMRSSVGTPGGRKTGQGVGSLSRFPVPLRPKALPGFSVLVVPNAAESARPKIAEFSAVWAYIVRGGFERRGVKAGPQATAQAARSGLYAS